MTQQHDHAGGLIMRPPTQATPDHAAVSYADWHTNGGSADTTAAISYAGWHPNGGSADTTAALARRCAEQAHQIAALITQPTVNAELAADEIMARIDRDGAVHRSSIVATLKLMGAQ